MVMVRTRSLTLWEPCLCNLTSLTPKGVRQTDTGIRNRSGPRVTNGPRWTKRDEWDKNRDKETEAKTETGTKRDKRTERGIETKTGTRRTRDKEWQRETRTKRDRDKDRERQEQWRGGKRWADQSEEAESGANIPELDGLVPGAWGQEGAWVLVLGLHNRQHPHHAGFNQLPCSSLYPLHITITTVNTSPPSSK